MSLLMDALKKAEETKRQAETGAFATAGSDGSVAGSGKALGASMPGQPASLPALPSRLELLDDQFTTPRAAAAAKPSPDQAAAAAAQEKDRQAAAQVFAAKTGSSDKSFQLVLGLSTAAAVLVIAGYFWWQLQPRSSLTAVTPSAHSSVPDMLGNSASVPASATAGAPSRSPVAAAPASGSKVAETPPPAPPSSETAPEAKQAAIAHERPPRTAVPDKGRLSDEAPALATLTAESAIRITRSRLRIDPGVANGYRHFQSGDLAAAQQEYERALRSDPRNTDALNGLAAISLRRNRNTEAAGYYQRALEADPMDATAQAGLINLRGSRDPRQTESRLRTLLAAQPDAHAAQFALGNLYAAQGQWREAQEAYFQAYSAVPDDPDYQFNLAVSLDQLHQPKPALQYYQSALAAAAARPAAFDQAQAAARVRELQP